MGPAHTSPGRAVTLLHTRHPRGGSGGSSRGGCSHGGRGTKGGTETGTGGHPPRRLHRSGRPEGEHAARSAPASTPTLARTGVAKGSGAKRGAAAAAAGATGRHRRRRHSRPSGGAHPPTRHAPRPRPWPARWPYAPTPRASTPAEAAAGVSGGLRLPRPACCGCRRAGARPRRAHSRGRRVTLVAAQSSRSATKAGRLFTETPSARHPVVSTRQAHGGAGEPPGDGMSGRRPRQPRGFRAANGEDARTGRPRPPRRRRQRARPRDAAAAVAGAVRNDSPGRPAPPPVPVRCGGAPRRRTPPRRLAPRRGRPTGGAQKTRTGSLSVDGSAGNGTPRRGR